MDLMFRVGMSRHEAAKAAGVSQQRANRILREVRESVRSNLFHAFDGQPRDLKGGAA